METKEQKIEDMDVAKQFMELMQMQNMGEQSQGFLEVLQYAASMQLQLAAMLDELQCVKEQLARMQADQTKNP